MAVSYETNDETIYNTKIEGTTTKLDVDLGYAFPIQEAFLKPYGKAGLAFYSEESFTRNGYYKFDDNNAFLGAGVRFQYDHFYTDLSLDYSVLEDGYYDYGVTQTALTAGYKF